MKKILIVALLLFPLVGMSQLIPTPGKPALVNPVKWTVSYSKKEVKAGDKVDVIISAEIEEGWYLYALGDPPHASIDFVNHPSYKLTGKVKEGPGIKEKYDELTEANVRYYLKKAEFRQTVTILKPNPVIEIDINGQVCSSENTSSGNPACVLVRKNLQAGEIKVLASSEPGKTSEMIKDSQQVNQNKLIDSSDTTIAAKENKSDTLQKSISASTGTNTTDKYADKIQEKNLEGEISLWAFILLAFGGGLISLLTPCVFPMVPLTVTFFTNASKTKGEAFKKAFVYGTSIVFVFTVIGLIISWTLGPQFATFLSNHWVPNMLFFLIFIVFGLSFLGLFEITLPSSFVNKVDAQSDKGGYAGIFFMALTLVLVSFSCTGPIVSSLLIAAARGEAVRPVLGMLAYSSAFALPFTFFALFPGVLSKLPKSGGWMNVIKVTLGFAEVALAFKFLSAVDRVYTLHILDRDIFIAIWIVVFGALGLYLLGKIRLPHDSETTVIGVPRLMLALATFTFVVYLIPGMFGAQLKALSGVLPPMSTHSFDLPGIIREHTADGKQLCDEPKYNKKYTMPHGLRGYFDYDQALKCAKESNKPLFIDFTGLNCANCIRMEENVWSDPEVLSLMGNEFVLVSLYTDDPTALPKEEVYISAFDKEKKKTIGDKNNDIQLGKFESNVLPYYILLDPHTEQPLVQGVPYTPSIVDYVKFLKSGVEMYKKKYPQNNSK